MHARGDLFGFLRIKELRRGNALATICGKKSRFASAYGRTRLRRAPPAATLTRESFHRAPKRSPRSVGRSITTGVDEVSSSSISYLPATFTTLFFLAASLLLGLMS